MNPTALLHLWHTRANVANKAHYKTAVRLEQRHWYMGFAVVGLNAVSGSAVLTTFIENTDTETLRVAAVIVAVAAGVLAAVQTFGQSGERAEAHHQVGSRFSTMQRELEAYYTTGDHTRAGLKAFVADFDARYSQFITEAITANEKCFNAAERLVASLPPFVTDFEFEEDNEPATTNHETTHGQPSAIAPVKSGEAASPLAIQQAKGSQQGENEDTLPHTGSNQEASNKQVGTPKTMPNKTVNPSGG